MNGGVDTVRKASVLKNFLISILTTDTTIYWMLVTVSAWLIYVGHCIVMSLWIPSQPKPSATLQLLQEIVTYSIADSCFPANQGPSASRLHDLFLRQFCDAHTCSGKQKPFSKGGKKETSVFYLAIAILTLMLLPIFYLIVYLHQSEMRKNTQELRRISKVGQKAKPS